MPSHRDAHIRHAKHFLQVIWDASKLCEQGGEEFQRGSVSFDEALDNIKLAQEWVMRNATEDVEAATLCSNYPDAGAYMRFAITSPTTNYLGRSGTEGSTAIE